MSEWIDIETVPTDGTKILVCDKHPDRYHPETAYFGTYHPNAKGKECLRTVVLRHKIYATHWQPLPEPPK